MDYKGILVMEGKIILKEVRNFNPQHIFECGQCFRWNRVDEEVDTRYRGVIFGKVVEVSVEGKDVVLENVSLEDFEGHVRDYLDLNRDYSAVKDKLKEDLLLKEAMDFGYGIRVLNQEPFETLISFILSANNGIPRIKDGVRRISLNYGKEIQYDGETYYAFPTPEELSMASEGDLRALGVGFRAKYIYDTTKKIRRAEKLRGAKTTRSLSEEETDDLKYDLKAITTMNHDLCHSELQNYIGVGPKVADCVMLFSMKKQEAFPVDVWVRKAMVHFYGAKGSSLTTIRNFGQSQFGDLSGFAQQYLFYHARENKIQIE